MRPVRVLRTDEDVLILAKREGVAAIQPLALDELELAGDARLQAHEDHPAILAVVAGARGERVAVRDAPADQTVTVDELAFERKAVARVGAADVGTDRAAQAIGVGGV